MLEFYLNNMNIKTIPKTLMIVVMPLNFKTIIMRLSLKTSPKIVLKCIDNVSCFLKLTFSGLYHNVRVRKLP